MFSVVLENTDSPMASGSKRQTEVSMSTRQTSRYGTLGLNVGFVGRWSRLIWGALILVPFGIELADVFTNPDVSSSIYGFVAMCLLGITFVYTIVYRMLGERVFSRSNPWINTVILVGPAWAVAWWGVIFAPLTGFDLPQAFSLAMGVYIGLSFILQWKIKYGGCEVVAVPIILFKKRYTTYCIPLVAFDVVEKKVVDTLAKSPMPDSAKVFTRAA